MRWSVYRAICKHESTVNDLHAMSSQCLSLHRDLEDARTAILALEWTIQKQESSGGKDIADTGQGCEVSQLDWDVLEQNIANEQLKARIRELENEKICVVKREADDLTEMRQMPSPGKVRPWKNDNEVGSQQQGGRASRSRMVKKVVKPEPV